VLPVQKLLHILKVGINLIPSDYSIYHIHCISLILAEYLKNRLLQTASNGSLKSLLHLLLTARAASASTMDVQKNLDNYAKWYKQNIGEMTYILGTEKFQTTLGLLEESLEYEKEIEYLEVIVKPKL